MIYGVTGHRPDKLGGYDHPYHPMRQYVKRFLRNIFSAEKPDKVITGMAQGVDQDCAEVCLGLGIPYVAAVPLKAQAAPWPPEARSHYLKLLDLAADVVVVCDDETPWAQAMHARNVRVVESCDRLAAVWDGSSGGTADCVKYAKSVKRPIVFLDWVEMKRWGLSERDQNGRVLAERSALCECDADDRCPCPVRWSVKNFSW